jgi:bacterioferritin
VRNSVAQSRKHLPHPVETQFLQDMRSITGRIANSIVADAKGRGSFERTVATLLQLALSLESTFAVWCWRHVHLERVNPNPHERGRLRKRAEDAMRDADLIAERLHQITGTTDFRVEWLPSASEPLMIEQGTLGRALRDEAVADRLAVDCYTELIDYVRAGDAPTAAILEGISRSRKRRLKYDAGRAVPRSA